MAWLEIIEIRATGSNREILKSQLQELIDDLSKAQQLSSFKVFRHVLFETDFSIHLLHESENPKTGCSTICSHLVKSLKDFGFVNHTAWIETINKGDKNESIK